MFWNKKIKLLQEQLDEANQVIEDRNKLLGIKDEMILDYSDKIEELLTQISSWELYGSQQSESYKSKNSSSIKSDSEMSYKERVALYAGSCFYGNPLEELEEIFKDEEFVVRMAVNYDGLNLKYASKRLKKDKLIAVLALNQNIEAYEFIDDSLLHDMQIIRLLAPYTKIIQRVIIDNRVHFSTEEILEILEINPLAASYFNHYLSFYEISDQAFNNIMKLFKTQGFTQDDFMRARDFISQNDLLNDEKYLEIAKQSLKNSRYKDNMYSKHFVFNEKGIDITLKEIEFHNSTKGAELLFSEKMIFNQKNIDSLAYFLLVDDIGFMYNLLKAIDDTTNMFSSTQNVYDLTLAFAKVIAEQESFPSIVEEFDIVYKQNKETIIHCMNKFIEVHIARKNNISIGSVEELIEKIKFHGNISQKLEVKNSQKTKPTKI